MLKSFFSAISSIFSNFFKFLVALLKAPGAIVGIIKNVFIIGFLLLSCMALYNYSPVKKTVDENIGEVSFSMDGPRNFFNNSLEYLKGKDKKEDDKQKKSFFMRILTNSFSYTMSFIKNSFLFILKQGIQLIAFPLFITIFCIFLYHRYINGVA